MSNAGKHLRFSRLTLQNRALILPIDHGFTMGPLRGIQSIDAIANLLEGLPVDSIIAHKGVIERLAGTNALNGKGVWLHINGMPNTAAHPDTKMPVSGIERALELGCDGLSLQLNFTAQNAESNWQYLGTITDAAARAGLPVLLMLYDKGEQLTSEDDSIARYRQFMRSSVELGVDALKIAPPENLELLPDLLEHLSSDIPIFLAGGDQKNENIFLHECEQMITAGAAGLCVGRNLFMSDRPEIVCSKLQKIIHGTTKSITLARGDAIAVH